MIGIMADSHDNREALKKAVRLFNDIECELVIHAGDFVAPFAAGELGSLLCPVKAVFGNCDGEKKGISYTISSFGKIKEAPFCFPFAGLNFLVTHTQFRNSSYLKSEKYDVLIFGHTHKPEISKQGKTLVINPGETGGWVTERCTVALLDPATLKAEIIPI